MLASDKNASHLCFRSWVLVKRCSKGQSDTRSCLENYKKVKAKKRSPEILSEKLNFQGRLLLSSRDRNGRQFAIRASQM